MTIIKASIDDAQIIASIVSESNKDVAEQFNLNKENNPKHPSFYTKRVVLSDFARGQEYFIYRKGGSSMGCVRFEHPRPDTAYLNRLSVLPKYRHSGIGVMLVKHVFEYSKAKNVEKVSIGIIATHEILKTWYLSLGFIEADTKTFAHLPFQVTYMRYEL